jgi:hypothetical protein
MEDRATELELKDRLNLIEKMISEGRRTTERRGWVFVLWGVAFYAAIAWSVCGHNAWAWPITMFAAALVTIVLAFRRTGNHPETTLGRAIGSVWIASGISMFLLFFALGLSGRLDDQHLFVAVVSAILGLANGASALILRWKAQLACAVVWWIAAVTTSFVKDAQSQILFLVAIFVCQIAFGFYGMIAEAQYRKRHAPIHA